MRLEPDDRVSSSGREPLLPTAHDLPGRQHDGPVQKREKPCDEAWEARAIKARAKLEARLAAKNEARRIKATERAETKAIKAQLQAQRTPTGPR